jgi:hypothetical protein
MLTGKFVLCSVVAVVPLLGIGAWYGTHSECCWPGCCSAKAVVPSETEPVAAAQTECCPDGPCCIECCLPGCCEDGTKVATAKPAKVSSTSDCCSSGSSCCLVPSAKKPEPKAVAFCPLCPFCP